MSFSIVKTVQYIYWYFLYYFFRITLKLGLFAPPVFETIIDVDNTYISPIKNRYEKLLKKITDIQSSVENNLSYYNQNIDPIFYNKKEFTEFMKDADNPLEKIWKTRILFENTPRGNIILFYDAYKLGFSFYCDQKVISYDLLNAAAMKYVSMYRCIDFFIDETIVEYKSPFIKLHYSEDEKKPVFNTTSDKSAFATMRNYGKENPNARNVAPIVKEKSNIFSDILKSWQPTSSEEEENKKPEPEKMKNKFLYLGKISNFKVLQSVPKKRKVLAKFTSPLLEGIKLDAGVQRETMSFKDFKKLKKSTDETATCL